MTDEVGRQCGAALQKGANIINRRWLQPFRQNSTRLPARVCSGIIALLLSVAMARLRFIRRLCFAIPAGVLVAAYVGIAAATETAWPWLRVVHEDGRRSLLETVVYFEHALRELPLDLLLAWAIAGAAVYFFPQTALSANANQSSVRWFVAAAVLLAASIVVGTWHAAGGEAVVNNLVQMHTRPGAALEWGTHWRYHLLSRLALLLAAFALFGTIAAGSGAAPRGSLMPYLGSLAGFVLLTIVFRLTADPFTDPVYLGHQARELLTHGLVTLPLAAGTCMALAAGNVPAAPGATNESRREIFLASAGAILLGIYVAGGAMLAAAVRLGQTQEFHRLLLVHFFEHTLGYLLVPVAAGGLYLWHAENFAAKPD